MNAGYVVVREVGSAAARLDCRARVAVVPGPGRGNTGLQVSSVQCEQGAIRADGRFHGQLVAWRLSGRGRGQAGGQQLEPEARSGQYQRRPFTLESQK